MENSRYDIGLYIEDNIYKKNIIITNIFGTMWETIIGEIPDIINSNITNEIEDNLYNNILH